MSFGQRLKNLRLSRELTQKEFADKTHVSVVTVRNWEQDIKKPNMTALLWIAQALQVSLDSLLDFSVEPKPYSALALSPMERVLLKQYRKLDGHGRKIVNTICSLELERLDAMRTEKPALNVVEAHAPSASERFIPRYTTPAAAGSSIPLDGADFEMILVDDSVPLRADYAVDVHGDSMYPYIKDGDMVYVQKDAELSVGDVGIWCVDGAIYCKQYYADEENNLLLVSANPNLRETNVLVSADGSSSVKCFGKVLLNQKLELPDYLFAE